MSTHHRDEYRTFASEVADLPLFMQPWYLDAVCPEGSWDAAVVQKNGRTVAVLPYFLKHKLAWKYVTMPKLCKQLGPFLLPEYRNLKWEMRLYRELIEQLPEQLAAFEQNFNYTVTNWLPFYWKGFKQTTQYSYTLSLEPPEELILKNIEKDYIKKINAAKARLVLRDDLPLSELHRLVRASFERQGLKTSIDFQFLQSLYAAISELGCGKLFFATDPETGDLHSAALLVWDKTSAYYLMSGDDPASRNSGAAVLLKWEAILYAKNVVGVPIFDFEGSMIRTIEHSCREFGAQQRPYFRVRHEWSVFLKWWKFLKS